MHGSHISHEPICHDSWVLYTRYLNRHVHKYFKGSGFAHVMEDKGREAPGKTAYWSDEPKYLAVQMLLGSW